MEVGARVEAYEVGGAIRHIQSAYFTFVAPDDKGNPIELPEMAPQNKVFHFSFSYNTSWYHSNDIKFIAYQDLLVLWN